MNSARGQGIAVFFSAGVGDQVLCLPALRALGKVLDGPFVLACSRNSHAFIFGDLPFDRLVRIPLETSVTFDPRGAAEMIGAVEGFISLAPWMSSSLSGLMSEVKPAWSVGFFPGFHRQLVTDREIHAADLAFRVPRAFDPELRLEDFAAPVPLPQDDVRKAVAVRGRLAPNKRILVVHNETLTHKMLEPGRLAAALHAFLGRHPEFIAISVGLQRHAFGHDRVIDCSGILTLPQSFALVASADLFLGVDSCFRHVADFARVPSVGLFGPTRSVEFGFRLGSHVAVQAAASMAEIEVADVLAALDVMLADQDHAATVAPGSRAQAAAFASARQG